MASLNNSLCGNDAIRVCCACTLDAFRSDRFLLNGRPCVTAPHALERFKGWSALMMVCLVLIASTGCEVAPSSHRNKNEIHAREDVAATQSQIRIRMRALAEPLAGAIVASADRIITESTDRNVQREALLWKIEGVPAVREALFRPDPYVALVDIWVLAYQMNDYFESGRGKKELGGAAPVAIKTCEDMQSEINAIATSFTSSGDVSDVRIFARSWAGDHPIRHSIGGRESVMSRVLELNMPERFSAEQAAGDAIVSLDDLTRRLDVYSVQLFDQARWQAQLIGADIASQYELQKAMPLAESAVASATDTVALMKRLEPPLNETLAVVKSAPGIIDRQRAAMVECISQERKAATMEFREMIAAERTAALEYATKERKAATTDVRETIAAERRAAMEYISKERIAALQAVRDTITEERQGLRGDAEQLSLAAIDHAVLRVAQLTGGVLAAAFLGIVGLLIIARRIFAAGPKS